MRPVTQEKTDQLLAFMQGNGIDALFLADMGNSRDVNVRYLSGQPMDATFVLTAGGERCLVPWDIQLAEEHAEVDVILDFKNYKNRWSDAACQYIKDSIKKSSPVIGVNGNLPYRLVLELQARIPGVKIFEEPEKVSNILSRLRSTKSSFELEKLIKAAKIGNQTLKDIRKFAEEAKDETENDLSFLVMKKMREYGAEDNSFPSLVANTERSYQIHCHPMASNNRFAEQGLALIDFGARFDGYCSDITVPFTFGELSPEQKTIRETTIAAYEAAIAAIDIGTPLWKISQTAVTVIEDAGFKMPHSLGHGLGLTVHDAPRIRQKPTDPIALKNWEEAVVEDGMVFTIEPGVYVKGQGGLRLENDVMIRNGKVEVITKSELIEL